MIVRRFQRYLYFSYRRAARMRYRFGRKVTRAGALVLFLMFAAGGLGLDTNLAMSYQFFALLAAIVLLGLLWSLWRPPALPVTRQLPRIATAGTPFRYQVTVTNPSLKLRRGLGLLEDLGDPCPTVDEFTDSPEPGERRRNLFDRVFIYYRWMWLVGRKEQGTPKPLVLPPLPPAGESSVEAELVPRRRGYLRFAATEITNTDPFGLFRARRRVENRQPVLVLPKRYFIPRLALPGDTAYQLGGVSLASAVGQSEEFISLRDYRRGDPPRHIHWRSTARAGRLIVKEFEDEFFTRHALILDTFQDHQPEAVFEEAVSVAASFACTADTQDSLLDLLFAGPRAYCFTIGRGVGQVEQMLEILACVRACTEAGVESLEKLMAGHLEEVSGCVCVLLAWDEPRHRLVRRIQAAGVPVLVLVVTEKDVTLEPGPMRDTPASFHVLPLDQIAERLARL